MHRSSTFPSVRARDGSDFATTHDKAVPPPRHRMRGGDLPRGGNPHGLGHAGRTHIDSLRSSLVILTAFLYMVGCISSPLAPRIAYADETLTFSNGATAMKRSDGTIVGECAVRAVWLTDQMTTFVITMPDGQELDSKCINEGWMVPADGSYPFTASSKDGGGYRVLVHSQNAAYYQNADGTLTSGTGANIQQIATQDHVSWNPKVAVAKGNLTIVKSSSNPSFTQGREGYERFGARYTIYRDEQCTESLGTAYELITDTTGTSNTVELEPGTYWVRETEAPKGFERDLVAHSVTVVSGATTTFKTTDDPILVREDVWATKRDADLQQQPQGGARFEGAELTVCYYAGIYSKESLPKQPKRTWVIASNAKGQFVPSESSKIQGDPFYTLDGKVVIPYGTVTLQETKAPQGYLLEGQQESSPDDENAALNVVKLETSNALADVVIVDRVMRGDVRIQKTDAELLGAHAQGDATLKNAEFSIVLESDQPVFVGNDVHEKGEVVGVICTDEAGVACTEGRALPYGTYSLRETRAPQGYLVNEGFSKVFSIDDDGKVVDLGSDCCADQVIRGGVELQKVSRETQSPMAQASATLEGALFAVTLESKQSVVRNDTAFNRGDIVCMLETDESGTARTDSHELPYGTYTITEVEAPRGYVRDEEWSQTIAIREDGVFVSIPEDGSVENQVVRGDLRFVKESERTSKRMGGIPFRITSKTTGESHVVVSDKDGVVHTNGFERDLRTNENDRAIAEDGTLDEAALDASQGIWFSGHDDTPSVAQPDLGALPFDDYLVEELRCSKNKLYDLAIFSVSIREHGIVNDLGIVTNHYAAPPSLSTSLSFGKGKHVVPADEHVALVDTISYVNLEVGSHYTLEAQLVDKNALPHDATPISTASLSFVPETSSGIIEVSLDADTHEYAGKTLVCYEILRDDESNEVVAEHKDPNDEAQTIHVPLLHTTLTDDNSVHETAYKDTITLVDSVSYQNLVPNRSYEIVGTLVDRETGKPLADEKSHVTATLIPKEANGTVQVVFSVKGSSVAGKSVVAFEQLTQDGVVLAKHEDLHDEQQTVLVKSKDTSKTSSPSASKNTTEKGTTDAKESTSPKPKERTGEESTRTPNTGDVSIPPLLLFLLGSTLFVLALTIRV